MTLTRLILPAVASMTAVMMSMAPAASAAPSGVGTAQELVDSLERNGYRVILNRTGAAPLEECVVTAVRPGRDITELETTGDDSQLVTAYTTVYVEARC